MTVYVVITELAHDIGDGYLCWSDMVTYAGIDKDIAIQQFKNSHNGYVEFWRDNQQFDDDTLMAEFRA